MFIDHDSQAKQLAIAGLTTRDMVATALDAIGLEAAERRVLTAG
jgi:hypothetical protein